MNPTHRLFMLALLPLSVFTHGAVADGHESDTGAGESANRTPCPAEFSGVTLIDNAKQCQVFSGGLPASIVHFSASDKQTVIDYYTSVIDGLRIDSSFNQHTLLKNSTDSVRVIVSPDGAGNQVDILIQ